MAETEILDPADSRPAAAKPVPAAPREPHDIIRDALAGLGLKGRVAEDITGRLVVLLSEGGWRLVHDAQPLKRTHYRVKPEPQSGSDA